MDVLTTPQGLRLIEGTVVLLSRFPGTKWVIRNGWYRYNDEEFYGWYFSSIPAQTTMPINDDDLTMLSVVTDDRCWGCLPSSIPSPSAPPISAPPMPPTPVPTPVYPPYQVNPLPQISDMELRQELDKAFITVQTIMERDKLKFSSLIPDGKLIRVNHVYESDIDLGPKYYRYIQNAGSFEEIHIENEVTRADYKKLETDIAMLIKYSTWKYIR